MAKKLFRVADQWVNLPFVSSLSVLPGAAWESEEYDEHWPRLHVQLLGNTSAVITTREAKAQGFTDIEALRAAISDAMEALE